jgi:hypothetical protein
MSTANALVAEYLARLERAAAVLPPHRRAELLEEIAEHIATARAAEPAGDEAGVRTILDRLGEPEVIVAAAQEDLTPAWGAGPSWPAAPPPRGTGLELAAVLMLTAGSLFLVIGWLVGVGLLWASSLWRVREKLLGTLVVPLGPGGVLLWSTIPTRTCSGSSELFEDGTSVVTAESCTGFALSPPLAVLTGLILLVGPVLVAVLLMRIARRRAVAPTA